MRTSDVEEKFFWGYLRKERGGTYTNCDWSFLTELSKEEKWLRKKKELDQKNYTEEQLKKLMPRLFSYAKVLGVSFEVHPVSFEYSEERWSWYYRPCEKKIGVSLDPETLQIIPTDSLERNHAFAHEIGHVIKTKGRNFVPCCFLCGSVLGCLFLELGAEVEARKVLDIVYLGNGYLTLLKKKYSQRTNEFIDDQCSLCLPKINGGLCPKAKEIGFLCRSLGFDLEEYNGNK